MYYYVDSFQTHIWNSSGPFWGDSKRYLIVDRVHEAAATSSTGRWQLWSFNPALSISSWARAVGRSRWRTAVRMKMQRRASDNLGELGTEGPNGFMKCVSLILNAWREFCTQIYSILHRPLSNIDNVLGANANGRDGAKNAKATSKAKVAVQLACGA